MYGWTGKILRIDLIRGNCSTEELSPTLAREYIGGRGLGERILFDEIDPRIDPLSPENKLIFATGPLTGTGVPAGGRFVVVGKFPLTAAIGNPCCGGFYFGRGLKGQPENQDIGGRHTSGTDIAHALPPTPFL